MKRIRGFEEAGLNYRLSLQTDAAGIPRHAARDMLDLASELAVRRFRGGRTSPIPMSTATDSGAVHTP